jgi:hypothetical protein
MSKITVEFNEKHVRSHFFKREKQDKIKIINVIWKTEKQCVYDNGIKMK